ncbi:unnamed protein product [Diamesa tonsa]
MRVIVILHLLVVLHLSSAQFSFAVSHIGSEVDLETYKSFQICESRVCLLDADRLQQSAAHNESIDPCVNFSEFACGSFWKYRALNERYTNIGFESDLELQYYEQRRKTLAAPVRKNEIPAVVVAQNFFKKCINSNYIRTEGKSQVLKYLESFGKFPLMNGQNWNINMTKIIDEIGLENVLNYKLTLCSDPDDYNIEIPCLEPFVDSIQDQRTESTRKNIIDFLTESFQIPKDLASKRSQDYVDFFAPLYTFQDPDVITVFPDDKAFNITDIKKLFNGSKFNWNPLKFINSKLSDDMQIIDDQKVLIKDIVVFEKIIKLIENADEMLLADIIMINILYNVREMFEVYPFDHIKEEYSNIKKTHQRFEICIDLLESNFRFPVQLLYVRKFLKPRVKVAAESLMKDAINYMINITMDMDKLDDSLKMKMSESLGAIQVVAGYPDELIDEKYLNEKLFNNLKLTGNEELFELYSQNPQRWNLKGQNFFSTFEEFPALRVLFFGANNDWTIYDYFSKMSGDELSFPYRYYLNWESKNGLEATLPGFRLTNRQMFWLSLRQSKCFKDQVGNTDQNQGDHYINNYPEFSEAFECKKESVNIEI